MMLHRSSFLMILACLVAAPLQADELPSVAERFKDADVEETPDFQRHIVPLLGKLGCNGRACHGSFQGRGGFRLSLFGYDFDADHGELHGRSDPETPSESLILQKPLMEVQHEGGQRVKPNSWEHRLLQNWVKAECPERPEDAATLIELQLTPNEIRFTSDSESVQLKAVAVWSDGTHEDVTDLCRWQTNDDQVADITTKGLVESGTPGDTHLVVFYDNAVVPIPVMRPVSNRTGDKYPKTPMPTKVDRLVVTKLKKLGIVQSDLCTDEEFLRRVSLDVVGALPAVEEIQAFVADNDPKKRSKKIDELLERPGYAAWWTTKLCDFTGNSDDQLNNVTPVRPAASQQWYDWIHKRVAANESYDNIVEGIFMAVSRQPGESYEEYCENMSSLYHPGSKASFADRDHMPHYWSRRNFQQNEDRVIGFAYTFLGVRIQCAQCHKHPFDRWTQDDFKGFQGFFTGTTGRNTNPRPEDRATYKKMLASLDTGEAKGNQLRREFAKLLKKGETVPFGEVFTTPPPKVVTQKLKNGKSRKIRKGGGRTATKARLLGQEEMDLTGLDDVRKPVMEWLRSKDNPLFAKAFVNRVWAAYFSVGIVSPPDDMNLANPPSNAALLDYLAKEFIAHDFDMKWLHREILNSRTYQLSWQPNSTNRLDERNFARSIPRRLPAEIAWDMVTQAVSSDSRHSEIGQTADDRAISIAGAGLRYAARGSNGPGYALTIFGRSIRESNCDCDRSEEPSLLQTIFMRNDQQILAMLDQKDGWLREVATENGLKMTAKSSSQVDEAKRRRYKNSRDSLARQLKAARTRLKKLQQAKNTPAKTLKKAQATVTTLQKRYKTADNLAKGVIEGKEGTPGAELPVADMVKAAYLRTLSRQPTDHELETASAFVTDAKDPIDGLRDVMWALLNTKEFIVNH